MSIEIKTKSSDRNTGPKTLELEPKIHAAKDLQGIARAAWLAVTQTRAGKDSLTLQSRKSLRSWLSALIIVLWLSVALGTLFATFSSASILAKSALAGIFLLSLIFLQGEFEVAKETYSILRQSQYFEPAELATFKRMMDAMRLERITAVYGVVLDPLLANLSLNRRKKS